MYGNTADESRFELTVSDFNLSYDRKKTSKCSLSEDGTNVTAADLAVRKHL